MPEQDVCFVIMPFSSPHGSSYSVEHFTEVYEDLFVPAIQAAGLRPLRADTTEISRHIVSDLLSTIESASIVLCDLSDANPNVLFELGWAFRADKRCVLVKDDLTQYFFDLQQSHIQTYRSSLKARLVREDINHIAQILTNTLEDGERRWSMVQSLGLDAKLRSQALGSEDPVVAAILDIREELGFLRSRLEVLGGVDPSMGHRPERQQHDLSTKKQEQKSEILAVLEEERGDVGRAAQVLGLSKGRLYNLIKVLGIDLSQTRS
jgi:hypothetical protein